MRTFEHFPEQSVCPVCKKSDDAECVLVPIAGTEDGNNIQAQPMHSDCLLALASAWIGGGIA